MTKVAKLKSLVGQPIRSRYLAADAEERSALQPAIQAERQWRIDKMRHKGFELEATVCDVLGVFVRGPAKGTVQPVVIDHSEKAAS